MFRAKGIAFYGSAASFNQHFICYLEPHDRFYSNCVAWMLLSGHQKLGHKQPSFWPLFSWQDYKRTGKSLPLAFFTSEQLSKQNCPRLVTTHSKILTSKKWRQMYCSKWDIRNSPSSALQIIVLIIKITHKEGMHMPNDFMEVLTMSFKKCKREFYYTAPIFL